MTSNALQLETLLAVMNPRKILRGEATLKIGQLREAAAMPKRLRKRVLRFVSTDGFSPSGTDYAHDDYASTLMLVSQAELPAQALFDAVPDRDLATELSIAAARIKTWANQAMPRDDEATFLSSAQTLPPALNVSDFMALWRVACDPMAAIYDLEDGQLDEDEVAILSLLWPEFYAAARQAVADAVASTGARKGRNWEPDPRKALLLRTLLQNSPLDLDLAANIQQISAAAQPQQGPAPKTRKSNSAQNDTASQESTAGTRAAAG